MFEKERYVEPANKALERINTKKIDIFKTIKNSYYFDINFLDENDNGYFPDSQEKDFRGQVQEGLERGNGIFIRLFQLFVDETGSFKDAEEYDDILVFDDTVYYEGYVKECYNDFWGYDEEDFDDDELDDDYDDEDYEDYDNCILSFHPRDARYNLPDVTVNHTCFHTLLNVCALLKTLH